MAVPSSDFIVNRLMDHELVPGLPAFVCDSLSCPAPLRTISDPYFFRTFSSMASRAASFFRKACCFRSASSERP